MKHRIEHMAAALKSLRRVRTELGRASHDAQWQRIDAEVKQLARRLHLERMALLTRKARAA